MRPEIFHIPCYQNNIVQSSTEIVSLKVAVFILVMSHLTAEKTVAFVVLLNISTLRLHLPKPANLETCFCVSCHFFFTIKR